MSTVFFALWESPYIFSDFKPRNTHTRKYGQGALVSYRRARLHGSGGPQVSEVTRLGGVKQ